MKGERGAWVRGHGDCPKIGSEKALYKTDLPGKSSMRKTRVTGYKQSLAASQCNKYTSYVFVILLSPRYTLIALELSSHNNAL